MIYCELYKYILVDNTAFIGELMIKQLVRNFSFMYDFSYA